MNALEFSLLVLSHRIRSGQFSAHKLADECQELSGTAHGYVPEAPNPSAISPLDADEELSRSTLNREYHRWFKVNRGFLRGDFT